MFHDLSPECIGVTSPLQEAEKRTELWKAETGKLQAAIRAYAESLTTDAWREMCRLVGMPFDTHHTPGGMILSEAEADEIDGLRKDLQEVASLIEIGERPGKYRAASLSRLAELLALVPCAGKRELK